MTLHWMIIPVLFIMSCQSSSSTKSDDLTLFDDEETIVSSMVVFERSLKDANVTDPLYFKSETSLYHSIVYSPISGSDGVERSPITAMAHYLADFIQCPIDQSRYFPYGHWDCADNPAGAAFQSLVEAHFFNVDNAEVAQFDLRWRLNASMHALADTLIQKIIINSESASLVTLGASGDEDLVALPLFTEAQITQLSEIAAMDLDGRMNVYLDAMLALIATKALEGTLADSDQPTRFHSFFDFARAHTALGATAIAAGQPDTCIEGTDNECAHPFLRADFLAAKEGFIPNQFFGYRLEASTAETVQILTDGTAFSSLCDRPHTGDTSVHATQQYTIDYNDNQVFTDCDFIIRDLISGEHYDSQLLTYRLRFNYHANSRSTCDDTGPCTQSGSLSLLEFPALPSPKPTVALADANFLMHLAGQDSDLNDSAFWMENYRLQLATIPNLKLNQLHFTQWEGLPFSPHIYRHGQLYANAVDEFDYMFIPQIPGTGIAPFSATDYKNEEGVRDQDANGIGGAAFRNRQIVTLNFFANPVQSSAALKLTDQLPSYFFIQALRSFNGHTSNINPELAVILATFMDQEEIPISIATNQEIVVDENTGEILEPVTPTADGNQAAEIEALKSQINELQASIDSMNTQAGNLLLQQNNMQISIINESEYFSRYNILRGEHDALLAQFKNLQDQDLAVVEKMKALQTRLRTKNEEIRQLEQSLATAHTENQKLVAINKKITLTRDTMRSQVSALNTKIDELELKAQQIGDENALALAAANRAVSEQFETQLIDLKEKLKDQKVASTRTLGLLKTENSRLTEKIQSKDREIETLTTAKSKLLRASESGLNEESKAIILGLNQQISDLKSEKLQIDQKLKDGHVVASLEDEIKQLETQLAASNSDAQTNALNTLLKERKEALDNAQRVPELTKKITELETKVSGYLSQINILATTPAEAPDDASLADAREKYKLAVKQLNELKGHVASDKVEKTEKTIAAMELQLYQINQANQALTTPTKPYRKPIIHEDDSCRITNGKQTLPQRHLGTFLMLILLAGIIITKESLRKTD